MRKDQRHTPDEDAALIASWRKGELASFEVLVGKYQKPMFNIAFRITGDYVDACEVVEDTFVNAFREIDSFSGAARFSNWLTTIVVTHSRHRLDRVQGKSISDAAFQAIDARRDSAAFRGMFLPVTGQGVTDDVHNHVHKCIGSLLADFREVLVLKDLQNVSCREIGAILKIREATVKSRLSRAREMMTDCLTRAVGEL